MLDMLAGDVSGLRRGTCTTARQATSVVDCPVLPQDTNNRSAAVVRSSTPTCHRKALYVGAGTLVAGGSAAELRSDNRQHNRLRAGIVVPMIYRAKLRVKVPGDQAATEKRRGTVLKLVEKHGGKNGTPNSRQHVTGIFTDKAAMKTFRAEASAALSA